MSVYFTGVISVHRLPIKTPQTSIWESPINSSVERSESPTHVTFEAHIITRRNS